MAVDRKTRTMIPYELGECPACMRMLVGSVTWEATLGEVVKKSGEVVTTTASMKAVGMSLSHDCQPRVVR